MRDVWGKGMKRNAMADLEKWADSKRRKPLILTGARQVGKTWLLNEFGKQHFDNVAYISFENNQRMPAAFDGPLTPERLIPILQAESGERIEPNKTLLILDEVQTVPRAIMSLKYFCEEAPEYAVAVAGSSLGIELHGTSFPVGKVSFLELHPLSFLEFLDALGMEQVAELIEDLNWDALSPFHNQLIELVRMYLYVGGMPECVSEFVATRDFGEVRRIQNELLESYRKDFSKYADATLAERLHLIWNAIPSNLAEENKKFIFRRIRESARAREFEDGLQWLEDAALIHRVKRVTTPRVPLISYQDDSCFKVFLHDVGLLAAMSNLPSRAILEGDRVFREFKGALGEQLALQEMIASGVRATGYYQNDSTRSEIDFLVDGIENTEGVVPVEVKYGTNLRARSLAAYVKKNTPVRAIRVSAAEHSIDGVIEDIPFYALSSALRPESEKRIAHIPLIEISRGNSR